jgi:predicted nucleic acid-binding protein
MTVRNVLWESISGQGYKLGGHFVLRPGIWQLRHNLSAYDGAYVALAEELGAIY